MRPLFSIALTAVLLTGSSQASEAPTFQKLGTEQHSGFAKPHSASPVEAPVRSVLTATLGADGKVITQCRTQHDHASDRQQRAERQQ